MLKKTAKKMLLEGIITLLICASLAGLIITGTYFGLLLTPLIVLTGFLVLLALKKLINLISYTYENPVKKLSLYQKTSLVSGFLLLVSLGLILTFLFLNTTIILALCVFFIILLGLFQLASDWHYATTKNYRYYSVTAKLSLEMKKDYTNNLAAKDLARERLFIRTGSQIISFKLEDKDSLLPNLEVLNKLKEKKNEHGLSEEAMIAITYFMNQRHLLRVTHTFDLYLSGKVSNANIIGPGKTGRKIFLEEVTNTRGKKQLIVTIYTRKQYIFLDDCMEPAYTYTVSKATLDLSGFEEDKIAKNFPSLEEYLKKNPLPSSLTTTLFVSTTQEEIIEFLDEKKEIEKFILKSNKKEIKKINIAYEEVIPNPDKIEVVSNCFMPSTNAQELSNNNNIPPNKSDTALLPTDISVYLANKAKGL